MAIREDPENHEPRALFDLVDFAGRHVLEIGCGTGRLTRRYAHAAARVTALDAFGPHLARARETLPVELRSRVAFQHIPFADFAAAAEPGGFDVAILSWSL